MNFRHAAKYSALWIANGQVVSPLLRLLSRRGLRILGYHGITLDDEHRFSPKLFMSPALFAGRMERLRASGHRVLSLGEAIDALESGRLPGKSVVLTFDDGWYGTYRHAFPILERLGFPATLYAVSWHLRGGDPVFSVFVSYIFWRKRAISLDLGHLTDALEGTFDLRDAQAESAAVDKVIKHGFSLGEAERQDLLQRLGDRLGVDVRELQSKRICGLMNAAELRDAADRGIRVELHTHTHRFPLHDLVEAERQIVENRSVLQGILGRAPDHFCYPAGQYTSGLWDLLESLGIRSATTTRRGLNFAGTPRYELNRFLDGEDVGVAEFAAFLNGAYEVLDGSRFRARKESVRGHSA